MRFYKILSVLFHPMVIPTIGVLVFLFLTPENIQIERQLILIGIVFTATYIIPLIVLILLKALGLIQSYKLFSIKERKIPMYLMLVIFYILAELLSHINSFKELGTLFYGIELAIVIIFILFLWRIKTSLHVLSLSSASMFFLIYGHLNSLSLTIPVVCIFMLLTGLMGTARLHLKAHTPREVYLGFFLGILCQFLVFSFL